MSRLFFSLSRAWPSPWVGLVIMVMLTSCGTDLPTPDYSEHPTTDGGISLSNLNAQIAHWQTGEAEAESPVHSSRRSGLIHALVLRSQVLLSRQDLVQAAELATQWTQQQPQNAQAWLMLAQVQASLHRYKLARQSLTLAAMREASVGEVAALDCVLELSTGNYTRADECATAKVNARPTPENLARLALVMTAQAKYKDAATLWADARKAYKDPSPFFVTYLALGEARMWMQAGEPNKALGLLADAHERLPGHLGVIVEHAVVLHTVGQIDQAISHLQPLLEHTDDPDVPGLLAAWLQETGNTQQAVKMSQQAEKTFEARLSQTPLADVAHAAEYWLGPGNNVAKALELAQQNLDNAATVSALALFIEAADTAGRPQAACSAAKQFFDIGDQFPGRARAASMAAEVHAITHACE